MVRPNPQSFEHIGPAIRRLREARGLRQSDLAEQVGINRASLSRVENGRVRPTLKTVSGLLDALDVSESELAEVLDSIRREREKAAGEAPPEGLRTTTMPKRPPGFRLSPKLREFLLLREFMSAVTDGRGQEWIDEIQETLDRARQMMAPLESFLELLWQLDPTQETPKPLRLDGELSEELARRFEAILR